jgi:hypothetical protein
MPCNHPKVNEKQKCCQSIRKVDEEKIAVFVFPIQNYLKLLMVKGTINGAG